MLTAIARSIVRAPRLVLAVAALAMAGAAIFGIPVLHTLSAGGMRDPSSESAQAAKLLAGTFGQGDMQMLVTVSSDDGVQSPSARAVGIDIVRRLHHSAYVGQVLSPWTAARAASRALVSRDGKTGLIVAGVYGGDTGAQRHARALADEITRNRAGVQVRAGGEATIYWQVNAQTQRDLLTMEAVAMPLSFVVTVWVFGGLVAASLPLAIGGLAVLCTMAALRAVSLFTNVSIFALNLTLAMGLGLAIDYTLLIISRFRDELAQGSGRDEALVRTMATAGRTVAFSAVTVALSMVTMVLFPQYFLKSFAYAGFAVVTFAAVTAIVVTPAVLALLGEWLNWCDVRRVLRRPAPGPWQVEQSWWYRIAKWVMGHAVPVGGAVVVVLLALGSPFLHVRWGFPDDRVLPSSASAHQVGDRLRSGFAADPTVNVNVAITDTGGVNAANLGRYCAELSRVSDVSAVSCPNGTFIAGAPAGPPSAPTAMGSHSAFLTVVSAAPLFSDASAAQLQRLHAVPTPAGKPVMMAGIAQSDRDSVRAVTSRLPLVLGIIAAVTLLLLFALTGSVVLPVKAILLNIISLSAAFGAMVWVFQDGHLGGLGTSVTGTLEVDLPVLLFCVAFGLSMDYEVFLISRIREFWLGSQRTPAANDESVALGIGHTGRVITAAALIMAISFAALMGAQVSFMRLFGLGLTVMVLVDATLVRMVLVPAFMHVLGRRNWWAPALLTRLHERFGVSERHRTPPTMTAHK